MSSSNSGNSKYGVDPSARMRRNREPSFIGSMHRRMRILFLMMLMGFFALAGELVHIQVARSEFYAARANSLTVHTTKIAAARGRILDRNGQPLAENLNVADVVVDPQEITDPNATATELVKLFDGVRPVDAKLPLSLSPTDIAATIDTAKAKVLKNGQPLRYLLIASTIPYINELAFDSVLKSEEAIAKHDKHAEVVLSGVSLKDREIRAYPNGDLGAQVLGFVTGGPAGTPEAAHLVGHLGIEGKMNSDLTGTTGEIKAEQDAAGRVISYAHGEIKPAVSGNDVHLTIDNTIQRIAQNELNASCQKYNAKMGVVIVVDPNNGDILALANNPTFDPNRPGDSNPEDWVNPAVSTLYEPGSTMKTLTLSAVMDARGVESMYETVDCTGQLKVDKWHTIHCAKDPPTNGVHGIETMREVMENSCNIGAYLYASTIGPQKLYDYEQRFGILDKPNSGLPYERYCGLVSPEVKKWPNIELANIAFGQGVSLSSAGNIDLQHNCPQWNRSASAYFTRPGLRRSAAGCCQTGSRADDAVALAVRRAEGNRSGCADPRL